MGRKRGAMRSAMTRLAKQRTKKSPMNIPAKVTLAPRIVRKAFALPRESNQR